MESLSCYDRFVGDNFKNCSQGRQRPQFAITGLQVFFKWYGSNYAVGKNGRWNQVTKLSWKLRLQRTIFLPGWEFILSCPAAKLSLLTPHPHPLDLRKQNCTFLTSLSTTSTTTFEAPTSSKLKRRHMRGFPLFLVAGPLEYFICSHPRLTWPWPWLCSLGTLRFSPQTL